ncbi:MAG: hypothetical protein OXG36_11195 [Caldilineaceae bacterium]|nr:hypothetical protein [Caldilineaceae bacterium]
MALFVLGFLIFIVVFTLAAVHGTRLAGRIMGERVNALHHAIETILETERIPEAWLDPRPANDRRAAQRQLRRALRRLRKTRAYIERTPSISDVESREYILSELDRIRDQWLAGELFPPPGSGTEASPVPTDPAPAGHI